MDEDTIQDEDTMDEVRAKICPVTVLNATPYPSCVPQAQNHRFQHTLVYCIGDNGKAGDSSARRFTLDFGIRGNAMPVTIK